MSEKQKPPYLENIFEVKKYDSVFLVYMNVHSLVKRERCANTPINSAAEINDKEIVCAPKFYEIIELISEMLDYLKDEKFIMRINLEKVTMAMVQKEYFLMKKVVKLFYNKDFNVPIQCAFINCSSSFEQIWSLISPLLSKDAKKTVFFEKSPKQPIGYF
jgi:hypothetical protein